VGLFLTPCPTSVSNSVFLFSPKLIVEEIVCNPLQQRQAFHLKIKQEKSQDSTQKVADFQEIVLAFGIV